MQNWLKQMLWTDHSNSLTVCEQVDKSDRGQPHVRASRARKKAVKSGFNAKKTQSMEVLQHNKFAEKIACIRNIRCAVFMLPVKAIIGLCRNCIQMHGDLLYSLIKVKGPVRHPLVAAQDRQANNVIRK